MYVYNVLCICGCVRKAPDIISLIYRALYNCELLLTHVWIRQGAVEDKHIYKR